MGDHASQIIEELYKQASIYGKNAFLQFVPLFIITPDNQVYSESKYAVSNLDLAPTILDASGVSFNINSNGVILSKVGKQGDELYFDG